MSNRTAPPESRHQWERLLRDHGFVEGRTACHGTIWNHPRGTFMLPRLCGHAKHLDPRMRKNMLSQLRRVVDVA